MTFQLRSFIWYPPQFLTTHKVYDILNRCLMVAELQEKQVMARQRKDSSDDNVSIDKQLIQEGTTQLNSEIQVLEAWLKELDASDGSDAEIIAARKSYKDMLRSRKEMLSSLTKQAKLQSANVD